MYTFQQPKQGMNIHSIKYKVGGQRSIGIRFRSQTVRKNSEQQEQPTEGQSSQMSEQSNRCRACGCQLENQPRGCDNGRIKGGLAAVPGFSWWPIEAYRPCPELSRRGLTYSRTGQALEDLLFKSGDPNENLNKK